MCHSSTIGKFLRTKRHLIVLPRCKHEIRNVLLERIDPFSCHNCPTIQSADSNERAKINIWRAFGLLGSPFLTYSRGTIRINSVFATVIGREWRPTTPGSCCAETQEANFLRQLCGKRRTIPLPSPNQRAVSVCMLLEVNAESNSFFS